MIAPLDLLRLSTVSSAPSRFPLAPITQWNPTSCWEGECGSEASPTNDSVNLSTVVSMRITYSTGKPLKVRYVGLEYEQSLQSELLRNLDPDYG